MIQRRGRALGLEIHPHQLRHTFAGKWLAAEGTEGGLTWIAGWNTRSVVADTPGRRRKRGRATRTDG